MPDIAVQASFNSGEWAPSLYARVDITKYRSGAALLQNYIVDYRGGASTRPGTAYVIQCKSSNLPVRLIPFQATSEIGYVLEFGDHYIRFMYHGAPVLENPLAITGASQTNPCVLQIPGEGYVAGDWIFVTGIGGMTQLNGRYFIVTAAAGPLVTIANLEGVPVNATGYSPYTSGGTAARIYTITSPYAAADLAKIKFAQNVNQMILCHADYAPQVLTEITATSWSLLPIQIGSSASAPTITSASASTSLTNRGTTPPVIYSYVVTSIDTNGQESVASTVRTLSNLQDMRSVGGTISISWNPVPGATAYNAYKSDVSYLGVIPNGITYGFIGRTTGTTFIDSNIAADYSQTPPDAKNPFIGSGVLSVLITAQGTYTTVPTITFSGGTPTITATAVAVLQVIGTPTIGAGGTGYAVGDTINVGNGVTLEVATESAGVITAFQPITSTFSSPGAITSGATPTNPVAQVTTSGTGTGATANLVWGVGYVTVLNSGAGYSVAPTVVFSSGAATATANLSPTSNGNPTVPSFFQQRLVLAAPLGAPQTFYMSQTGNYYNFNTSIPVKADDSIEGTLVSGVLNTIKSVVSSTSGMLILSDKASWLVNGGSSGSAVTPSALVANAQSFNGANDVPPIVANYDVLYVQEKGSSIRDLSFNIYFNVFTGTDISIISSHLFFGYQILEWAWAEEPYKVVWAIRNDGTMLTLTFLKEQDFIGWAHSTTQGQFKSVATVTEFGTVAGVVDAVYTIVQRTINSNVVQYIERVSERFYPNGVVDAWCVDAGLQYVGTPATTFSGGEHLAGATVTGLADGVVIPPFVMPINGVFTLPQPASKVTIGLGYTCDLQTLALDLGEPSVQGKVKKINFVDVRVNETLGLSIGADFNHLTPMKDLVIGNVSSMLTGQQTQVISGLVSGDARTFMSPAYTVPGQYCIRQPYPLPATILGVFPGITQGDER